MTITVCELENGPVEMVSFPIKNGDLNHSCVSLAEGAFAKWWRFRGFHCDLLEYLFGQLDTQTGHFLHFANLEDHHFEIRSITHGSWAAGPVAIAVDSFVSEGILW